MIPALLTRRSSRPNVSTACATSSRQFSGSDRSAIWMSALPPPRRISRAVCSVRSASRPASMTRYPCAASSSAMARPKPELAPVTSAALMSLLLMLHPFVVYPGRSHGQPHAISVGLVDDLASWAGIEPDHRARRERKALAVDHQRALTLQNEEQLLLLGVRVILHLLSRAETEHVRPEFLQTECFGEVVIRTIRLVMFLDQV